MNRGIALQNTPEMGVPDFPGNTVDSRGQTYSMTGRAKMVSVLKCLECGGYTGVRSGESEGAGDICAG